MSEYQRYEWMTVDRPLTRTQLDAVNKLSSHIEASSGHALIEYHWGDFKHDPIKVLHKFFDGFLYWANWGCPELAFRFPHGVLPADLIDGYDCDDYLTFTKHPDYDILHIQLSDEEPPDEWMEGYELGSLMPIRDELMEGDQRALYIVWLATQPILHDEVEEDEIIYMPIVPPGFNKLTAAQKELAELLRVPDDLLTAAGRHSKGAIPTNQDDFAAWVGLLPQERRKDYLVRLANNEPGLSRLLVKELRDLGAPKTKATPPTGERVTYTQLVDESKAIKTQREREKREQERLARQRHLQEVHDHQEEYWQQINQAVERPSGARYEEAVRMLVDLRDAAKHFEESEKFQTRFRSWVVSYLRRPALVKRLQDRQFPIPEL
jgi:hypothetical protein